MKARDLIEGESAKQFIARAAAKKEQSLPKGQVTIVSSQGLFSVDLRTGNVLNTSVYPDGYPSIKDIVRFDMKEWFKSRPKAKLEPGDTIDILDIGYWLKDGYYEPPAHDWRAEFRLPWRGQD